MDSDYFTALFCFILKLENFQDVTRGCFTYVVMHFYHKNTNTTIKEEGWFRPTSQRKSKGL